MKLPYNRSYQFKSLFSFMTLALLCGCEDKVFIENLPGSPVLSDLRDVGTDPAKAVCNPFGSAGGVTSVNYGIVGKLYYLNDNQPRYSTAVEYVQNGQALDSNIFLGEYNVPTRSFDRGFFSMTGDVIKNQNGNTLYEYFALDTQSVISLTEDDEPGNYQFALLSDDGAVFSLDYEDGRGFQTVVNNDGTHATRFGCATQPVRFDQSTRIPLRLQYYQGPRYHIAMMLLWRPWRNDNTFVASDPECGRSGNDRYFNYNVYPSTPQAAYTQLLARGWSVVKSANFSLPDAVRSTPCQDIQPVTTSINLMSPAAAVTSLRTMSFEFDSNYADATFQCKLDNGNFSTCVSPKSYANLTDGAHTFTVRALLSDGSIDSAGKSHSWSIDATAPLLDSLVAGQFSASSAVITWNTNEPTSSKILYGSQGQLTFSVEDLNFSTSHQIPLEGLLPFTVYTYQVSSIDAAGNTTSSSNFIFRTLR